ncbi:MAG: SAV_2336 N-terminal domain-related protein, partial [Leptolyngbyaceae cyanobacterium MO_188.B28]|nr:SAV_2336 N-terminal domain-related protein [Leptolyngbyaceae cyanobacterium MO_188.B28]
MSDSLQAFIQCLRYAEKNLSAGVGLGPGVEEIADMLWLAEKLPGPNAETDHHDDDDQQTPLETSPSPIEVEEVQSGVNEESSDEPSDTEETQSAELIGTLATHAERSEQASTTQAKPLTIPAASALRHPLKVARSLRALARKTESRTQKIIDEEATAIAIAEKNPVGIVQRPAQEKWLELELIIEYSRAAAIWERTSKEFVELLECLGAFRTVRVWTLEIREDNNGSPLPVLTSGRRSPDGKTNRFGKPKELIDPTGQRLVMLLSDCISPLWREGLIHGWLADWAKNGPTVIVQCFPEEYWSRTGLKCGNEVWLSAVNPGTPSNRLTRHYMGINPEDWSDSFEETSVKSKSVAIPVVSLEHESLRKWSRVVAGCGGSYVRGRRFELSWDGAQWRGPERKPKQLPSSAAEKVRLFFETASGMARELAGLMSLGPVSPEITNLIQETLLPGSETVHVAEVFLSGLLETTDNGAYQFVPGVKDLLRKAMLKVDEKLVFQVLSRYISDRYGQTPQEFTAFLQKHSDWSEEQWNELEGFAELRQHLQVESIKSISERKLDEHSQEGSRSEDKVGDLREELKSALTITDEQERTETLANLKGQSTEVLSNLLQSLSTIENETELVSYLISLIPHLPGTLLPKALEIVRTIQNTYSRFQGLTAVSALLPEVLPEALQTAQAIESEEHRAAGLITLIDKTPSEFLPQALDITQTTQDEKFRAEVLRALVNKLPPELLPQALDITQTIQDGVSRAATLKVLADTLPIELLPQAQKIAQAIEDEEYQSSTLATLANKWPKEQETGSEEIVNDVAGSGDETLSRKLNTPFGIPQSHPPIQQRPKISRRRDFYLKRLAQSEEELAAVEADFEAAPNASA